LVFKGVAEEELDREKGLTRERKDKGETMERRGGADLQDGKGTLGPPLNQKIILRDPHEQLES